MDAYEGSVLLVFEKISAIDFIQSTATHFVLKKYKDHGVSMADSLSLRGQTSFYERFHF